MEAQIYLFENRSKKKKSELYHLHVNEVHSGLRLVMEAFASEDYTPLHSGLANLYSLKIDHSNKTWFAKVTQPNIDQEYFFYNLLLRKAVISEGQNFVFNDIQAIVEANNVRGYLFTFIPMNRVRYDSIKDVDKTIMTLAEMNCRNMQIERLTAGYLKNRSFRLRGLPSGVAHQSVLCGDANQDMELRSRHETIISNWDSVVKALTTCNRSLISNDANTANICAAGDRICMLDMGQASIGPLGAELFWLMREAGQIVSHSVLFKKFRTEAKKYDVSVAQEEITLAACAAYATKWLNVDKKAPSTLSYDSYLLAIDAAEACIRICQSDAGKTKGA